MLPVEVAELVRQAIDRAVELLDAGPDDSAESRSAISTAIEGLLAARERAAIAWAVRGEI